MALEDSIREMFAMIELEIRRLRHDRTEIYTRAVQPILWLGVFGTIMGRVNAIPTGGLPYIDYITEGSTGDAQTGVEETDDHANQPAEGGAEEPALDLGTRLLRVTPGQPLMRGRFSSTMSRTAIPRLSRPMSLIWCRLKSSVVKAWVNPVDATAFSPVRLSAAIAVAFTAERFGAVIKRIRTTAKRCTSAMRNIRASSVAQLRT